MLDSEGANLARSLFLHYMTDPDEEGYIDDIARRAIRQAMKFEHILARHVQMGSAIAEAVATNDEPAPPAEEQAE